MKNLIMLLLTSSLFASGNPTSLSTSTTKNESSNLYNIPTRTIKAHSRSESENARNRKNCEAVGAVDVSDEQDMQVGINTIDAIICISNKPESNSASIVGVGSVHPLEQ